MSIYKRRSSRYNGSLTGGSGDVNPQWMHLNASQSAADTTTTTAFPIPIQRLQNAGRAQVMEILKVMWGLPVAVEADNNLSVVLSTSSFGTTTASFSNTRIIDIITRQIAITTSGQVVEYPVVIHDLTDGAGHGILIGTDNLYLQISSASTGGAVAAACKILYRWKDVSTTEYVGIVQGQQ